MSDMRMMAPLFELLINLRTSMFLNILALLLATYVVYLIWIVIYNLYFHPLAHFPGPVSYAATPVPYVRHQLNGRLPFMYRHLHTRYGKVVRVLPNKLSFASSAAWRDIYANHAGSVLMSKDPTTATPSDEGVHNVLTVIDQQDHARFRKILNPAFSDKALKEQETYIMGHVHQLMAKLHRRCDEGPQNIVKWSNLIYFDIIADLTFGQSLHGLQNEDYHPWLKGLFGSAMKYVSWKKAFAQFPHVAWFLGLLMPKSLVQQRIKHAEFVRERTRQRMTADTDRHDFMSNILPYDAKSAAMSMPEVRANFGVLMIAGSENVATSLTFAVYNLLKNPECLEKLTQEVRSSVQEAKQLDFATISTLRYLSAVVRESMRLKPAAPTSQPRVVPPGGAHVDGHWLPAETRVAVPPLYMNHNPESFEDPETFIPERWLGDARFESDNHDAFQPFGVGPRSCAGRSLALMEVRTVLAHLVWHFDLKLAPGYENWADGLRIYHLWDLTPLLIDLSPVT